ncbi:histidine kinase dimerization/phosphoacceptor domain -containing protein [Tropicibacter naphthalenivorans]|uniref:Putative sensor histidine kinase pdtaS n=1 Tax=Tropicibacter naphthalenivorans TaxID=441103 RepID=A0A0P1GRC2_9RHOB|nr:histidine kinase dimerization/phosphoacceptor domain -containing protein [Tropicibacter naphthalenivorans]CUH77130.1 putative sensor histidine kinase pdtaS [Tropicibacter naphthalenivorans]SMC60506.1 Two-component sensor histidine kinase, contains HisKA and HATPase domains [Tropicibacter naphthalenivorans]
MLAAKSQNEGARLAELQAYDILDTAPEADFDDVLNLVAKLLEVPVALVSLVDQDRQWFKARTGFDPSQTPLDQAICAHAILGDDILEIPDTMDDARTADNPLCCGPLAEMRFYAGAPLISPTGHRLGTLCVLDSVPRKLNDLQRETLRVMANQVMRQLDLRRALAAEEVLRDEIDHRVKNSLQTVDSLVRLYRARAKHDETRGVLDAVARRVTAVAELHLALYRADLRHEIPLDDYMSRVVALLNRQAPEGVRLIAEMTSAKVTPDAAQALAVIVSEFVANTFKHAFAPGSIGEVRVTLTQDAHGLTLTCADNGNGGGEGSGESGTGIGLRLMEAAADQLGAQMELGGTDQGYALRLTIPAPETALQADQVAAQ